jgi:glycosyltransferase involved in cell wall biosynthesis
VKDFLIVASYPDSLLNFRGPLIRAVMDAGHTVHAAAPGLSPHSQHAAALRSMGVQVHDIPLQRTGTNPVSDLKTLLALVSLMRRLKADGVLGYTIKPVIYGTLAAALAGVPRRFALVTGLGYAFQEESKPGVSVRTAIRSVVRKLYTLSLKQAHVVFFQNPDDQALFRQQGILSAATRSVVVNGSGVDIKQYAYSPIPAGKTGPGTVFLLIARLLGDKGIREYVAAARRIKARYPSVVFRLVGWIDENPDAIRQQELDGWVAEGVVEFLGRLADVRPAIADCTVYVLPSYREGTPRTVLEAMAMGRPIITADAPGCRETVVDGDNGFLVPVKAVDELVAAMEKFVLFPGLVEKMGNRSRTMAEVKYDVNAVNAVMLREMGIAGAAA